jgi:uncharacterized membrane protein
MIARFAALSIFFSTFWFAHVPAALADFRVCNATDKLVGVAVGYRDSEDWITEGWFRVPAESCASVLKGKLQSRYYYLFAEDAESGGQWRGDVFMCTSDREFKINGVKDCFSRGYERTGFQEVDTSNQESWMVRLTDEGQTQGSSNSG